MRPEQTIFDDLARLCISKGFIHALAFLSWRDNVLRFREETTAQNAAGMCSADRLIRTEFTTLVGLMMRAPIDCSLPTPEELSNYMQKSESLLQELHSSMLPADPKKFFAAATDEEAANPFASGENLREPIFYAAESAYSFNIVIWPCASTASTRRGYARTNRSTSKLATPSAAVFPRCSTNNSAWSRAAGNRPNNGLSCRLSSSPQPRSHPALASLGQTCERSSKRSPSRGTRETHPLHL